MGSRTSGSHGDLITNPDPTKSRRVRQRLFGKVIVAVGPGKWNVHFDNGAVKDCHANTLRIENSEASTAPDATGTADPVTADMTGNETSAPVEDENQDES